MFNLIQLLNQMRGLGKCNEEAACPDSRANIACKLEEKKLSMISKISEPFCTMN